MVRWKAGFFVAKPHYDSASFVRQGDFRLWHVDAKSVEKKANNAYAVSHSHRRTKRLQEANLQWKRFWWPQGNRWVRLRVSTKMIKTIQRKGLAMVAKEAGLDLNKF